MRRTILIAALCLCAGALATTYMNANAAPSATPISTLQKQVKTLQKQMKQTRTEVTDLEAVTVLLSICQTEITADGLQGTWSVIDQLAAKSGTTFFGPQQPVSDPISVKAGQEVCSVFKTARLHTVPPTIIPFQTFLNFFGGGGLRSLALLHSMGGRLR